ncbi:helix-turn-helix domain-containing protein [Streptomyces marokkonensis]|uniref:Helix-turn-helix domain-containing protein n=1 Tax=Streptomyces marokkonensis TaxID=324855 RepID=A0ABW6Q0T3_9ACTN
MTVENNGPLPGSGSQRVPLSRQRRGVLQYLRGQSGPVTATALAQVCALHVNTVREHLDALVEDGLAARERSAPAGRGRPAWRYRARPPQESPAREYAGLAAVLAARIARTSADPRADALAAGEDWGHVLTTGQEPSADPREARRRLLDLLGEIGFAPEADPEARRVRLPRCPFVETAREHPGVVCGVHEGLARAALAALGKDPQEVELLPFAEPDACRLHLATGGLAPDAGHASSTPPGPGHASSTGSVPGADRASRTGSAPGPGHASSTGSAPDAGRASSTGSAPDAGHVPDAGAPPITGTSANAVPTRDTGGLAPDAGHASSTGSAPDAGHASSTPPGPGHASSTGSAPDAGHASSTGSAPDAGHASSTPPGPGHASSTGSAPDAGRVPDAGAPPITGTSANAVPARDTGSAPGIDRAPGAGTPPVTGSAPDIDRAPGTGTPPVTGSAPQRRSGTEAGGTS